MDPNSYGLVEMAASFGVVLLFLVWQLIVTRRGIREQRERDKKGSADVEK
jgi:hypothetical protein